MVNLNIEAFIIIFVCLNKSDLLNELERYIKWSRLNFREVIET